MTLSLARIVAAVQVGVEGGPICEGRDHCLVQRASDNMSSEMRTLLPYSTASARRSVGFSATCTSIAPMLELPGDTFAVPTRPSAGVT